MIYLIGGPPKCGKTTLAKYLSKKHGIPWVSTDTLQNVIKPYVSQGSLAELFPANFQREESNDIKFEKYSSEEIISAYQQQAKTVYDAIDMFCVSEITDGNNFVIEGYHVEPELLKQLIEKYSHNIKGIFLTKFDEQKFILNIKKSETPNDWILARTFNDNTYDKISKMICSYSIFFKREAEKYGFYALDMDDDFERKIEMAENYLI